MNILAVKREICCCGLCKYIYRTMEVGTTTYAGWREMENFPVFFATKGETGREKECLSENESKDDGRLLQFERLWEKNCEAATTLEMCTKGKGVQNGEQDLMKKIRKGIARWWINTHPLTTD